MLLLSYIDPSTTALIWQIVAGILISLGVVMGIWWRKVRTFFNAIFVKLFKKKNTPESDSAAAEADEELADLMEGTPTPDEEGSNPADEEVFDPAEGTSAPDDLTDPAKSASAPESADTETR